MGRVPQTLAGARAARKLGCIKRAVLRPHVQAFRSADLKGGITFVRGYDLRRSSLLAKSGKRNYVQGVYRRLVGDRRSARFRTGHGDSKRHD